MRGGGRRRQRTQVFRALIFVLGGVVGGLVVSTPAVATLSAPSVPVDVAASPGSGGSASVSFTVPADNGSGITEYGVVVYQGSVLAGLEGVSTGLVTTAGSTETLNYGVTSGASLQSGSSYTFAVFAVNAAGASPLSALSNTVTQGAPSVPVDVAASPGSGGSASVSFTVPADNGSGITEYGVVVYQGSVLAGLEGVSTGLVTTAGSTETLNYGVTSGASLQSGSSYTFAVFAVNAAGASPLSALSNTVTSELSYPATIASVASGAVSYIESSQVTSGQVDVGDPPIAGAIAQGPLAISPVNDESVNPYLSGYAAAGLAVAGKGNTVAEADVLAYLQWYAGAETPGTGIVYDWAQDSITGVWSSTGMVDSVDAPPALFLVAADDYWAATGNETALLALKSGFQGALTALGNDRDTAGFTEQDPATGDTAATLEDNAEAFGGLEAANHLFTDIGDAADANAAGAEALQLYIAVQEDLWMPQNPGGAAFAWEYGSLIGTTSCISTPSSCTTTNWSNPSWDDPMYNVWAVAWGLATPSEASAIMDNPAVADLPLGNPNALVPEYTGSGTATALTAFGAWGDPLWALQSVGETATAATDLLGIDDYEASVDQVWPDNPGLVGELAIAAAGVSPVPSS